MPIYEFECKDCTCRFEVKRPISEMSGATVCPSCGSSNSGRKFPMSCSYLRYTAPPITNRNNHYKIDGIHLDNIMINRCGTGIRAKNARVRGKNVKMKDTRIGIDAEDSDISIKDLRIE